MALPSSERTFLHTALTQDRSTFNGKAMTGMLADIGDIYRQHNFS
jgi:hypothetical protein